MVVTGPFFLLGVNLFKPILAKRLTRFCDDLDDVENKYLEKEQRHVLETSENQGF